MHVHAPDMAALVDPQRIVQLSHTEPRCPVCQGMGTVGQDDTPGAQIGHVKMCKACGGSGFIAPAV